MRVPFKWLGEYVDLSGLSAGEVAEKLGAAGVAIEHVEKRNRGVSGVVVGHIVTLEQHPNADRLKVASVDVGASSPLQVVTGAPNVRAGDLVPVSVVGARVAKKDPETGAVSFMEIKDSRLRGVASQGMMCSADELDLVMKDLPAEQREGVMVFPPGTPVGASVLDLLAIDEEVLVVEPFANRPDYLSIIGIAREAAAALGRPLKDVPVEVPAAEFSAAERVRVTVADAGLCPRYTARVIEGVRVGPTPAWMAGRLHAAGVRSVNNVVDISNYVMLETGQPLHTFDHARVRGGSIEVRAARDGEKMKSIDGMERELDGRMLVIADAEGPVAIAGVMGGLDSEVSAATTSVLLESALFHPASVRRTSNRLALRSESSRRFEKGLSYDGVDFGSRRAAWWLHEICGGTVASGVVDIGVGAPAPARVRMRPARVCAVLGASIPEERMEAILRGLHFDVSRASDGAFEVGVPSFRLDVRREEDLAEEVARHYGYDHIPSVLPRSAAAVGGANPVDRAEERIRDVLAGLGMFEAITLSLLHPSAYEQAGWRSERDMRVHNPLVADQSQIRTTVIPHLLGAVAHNLRVRMPRVKLFELSKVYLARGEGEEPEERRRLGIVMAGHLGEHGRKGEAIGFFDLKGVVEGLLAQLGICATWSAHAGGQETFHPGKTADVSVDGASLGVVGALHPAVQERLDLPVEVLVAELDLDRLVAIETARRVEYRPISRFPEVERDVALVVSADVSSGRVEGVVREAGGELLLRARNFDVYEGAPIPSGHKSLAYALAFGSRERTLTDAEIDAAMRRIVERAGQELGATVRS